jgi:hypothetical protein
MLGLVDKSREEVTLADIFAPRYKKGEEIIRSRIIVLYGYLFLKSQIPYLYSFYTRD